MKLLTREQAAKIFDVTPRTFWGYVDQGIVKPHTTSRRSGITLTHLWKYQDVIDGKKALKEYKKGQQEMKFESAEAARKHKEVKAGALQDMFNLWLHDFHNKAIKSLG